MNDVVRVLRQYFSEESGNEVHYLGTSDDVKWFSDMLVTGQIIEHEAPDLLLKKDNDVLLIEHFEFDSFPSNRNGSKNKSEQGRIDRIQKSLPASEKCVAFNEIIHGDSTYDNYCKNVITSFNKHYNKIRQYISNVFSENLVESSQNVRIMFLIDDTSPIGSMAIDRNGNLNVVTLACCDAFISRLEHADDLNYVLCTSSAGNKNIIWFINLAELAKYKDNIVDYKSMRFFGSNPHVIGAKIAIPDSKLQEEII